MYTTLVYATIPYKNIAIQKKNDGAFITFGLGLVKDFIYISKIVEDFHVYWLHARVSCHDKKNLYINKQPATSKTELKRRHSLIAKTSRSLMWNGFNI